METTYYVESKEPIFSCAVRFGSVETAIAEAERRIRSGAFSAAVYAVKAGEFSGEKVWAR